MIDLKDFTIEELLEIGTDTYVSDHGECRECTDRELAGNKLLTDLAVEYLRGTSERRILDLPIPLYSIVYAVTEERAFNYESGKQPLCENQMECNPDCELNGKECRVMPFVEQKIYVPNSIWFDYITNNWGTKVFGTFKEAVKYIMDKYEADFCNENGLPTLDEHGNVCIPGFSADHKLIKAYNNESFGKPVIPQLNNAVENAGESKEINYDNVW
jgi:hypothetical protein